MVVRWLIGVIVHLIVVVVFFCIALLFAFCGGLLRSRIARSTIKRRPFDGLVDLRMIAVQQHLVAYSTMIACKTGGAAAEISKACQQPGKLYMYR